MDGKIPVHSSLFSVQRPVQYLVAISRFMTAIFGEIDKWVPMSPNRVTRISWTSTDVTASLQGAPNETFAIWYMYKSKADSVTCHLTNQGLGAFRINGEQGYVTCSA